MDLADLQQLLARIAGVRVVAVGDLMVDRFVHGAVARISAEAPIPVMAPPLPLGCLSLAMPKSRTFTRSCFSRVRHAGRGRQRRP